MATLTEQVADRLTGGQLTRLQEQSQQQGNMLAIMQESLTRLEQTLYDDHWRRLAFDAEQEFTRPGLRQIVELARIMKLKNPIIQRGVGIQRLYVWAQGMTVAAADERINEVVQAFMDDERNRAELTGHQARGEAEESLHTDGNLFICFHTNAQTGQTRITLIEPNTIEEIVCNPENRREPWFYKRSWTQTKLDGTQETKTAYYPDWQYQPKAKTAPQGWTVLWDKPVYHVAVNRQGRWGVSEVYAALDWALAYKSFLENLASVWQALARWAMKLTVAGGKGGIAAAKSKLSTTLTTGSGEGNPPSVTGSTFIAGTGTDLQPFRTAGATMNAEDGRRLFLMAAAVIGYPETFYGDASVGTMATAKALDRPTELKITDRQALWSDIFLGILRYVVLWAVAAPQGPLKGLGTVVREPDGKQYRLRLIWNKGVNGGISATFPPIVETDVPFQIGALVDATTLKGQAPAGTINLRTFTQQAATMLGIPNVDELIASLEPFADEVEQPEPAPTTDTPDPDAAAMDDDMMAERQAVMKSVQTLLTDLREAIPQNGKEHEPVH